MGIISPIRYYKLVQLHPLLQLQCHGSHWEKTNKTRGAPAAVLLTTLSPSNLNSEARFAAAHLAVQCSSGFGNRRVEGARLLMWAEMTPSRIQTFNFENAHCCGHRGL
jgi:hypothetical protein